MEFGCGRLFSDFEGRDGMGYGAGEGGSKSVMPSLCSELRVGIWQHQSSQIRRIVSVKASIPSVRRASQVKENRRLCRTMTPQDYHYARPDSSQTV